MINFLPEFQSARLTNSTDSLKKNSVVEENSSFENILSVMMSSSSAIVGSGNKLDSLDFSSLFLLLFIKLFGENTSTKDLALTADSPNGAPLNGIITQSSHAGHVALDFGVPVGTPVHATMSGKVTYAGWNNEGYGNLVIVENGSHKTYYAHLSQIPVTVGQIVKDGTIIGQSGNTGNSTGPHLHYEVRKNGVAIDPTTTIV